MGLYARFHKSVLVLFTLMKLFMYIILDIHCVAKVYAVFPFYDVKCLCSGGQE